MNDKPSKISYVFWLIRNWFTDAWFFCRGLLRNSAPNFLYRIWDFFTYTCSSIFQWFRTLGARTKYAQKESQQALGVIPYTFQRLFGWVRTINVRAKVARQERREAAGRISMGARSGINQFYSFIIDVIKSPVRFVRWLIELFRILRSMSLKAALKEAWGGYREFVERTFEHFLLLIYRFLDSRWWIRGSIIILIIGGISAIVFGPWAIRSFKDYRSMQVYAEAKQLQEENRLVEAYAKSRTAAMLNLDNPETLDLVIELGEETMNPESVWWAERKAITVNYTEESLIKIIELAAKAGFPEIGQKYLYTLRQKYPDSPGLTDSQLQLLMSMHMRLEAFQLAEQAESSGEDSITMHLVLVSNAINSLEPAIQTKLMTHLQEHLYREDEVGLAIQRLILASDSKLNEQVAASIDYERLLEAVRSQADATPADISLAIGIAFKKEALSRDEAIEALAATYDLGNPSEREQAIHSATTFELYEFMDQLEPDQVQNISHLMKRLILGPTPDLAAAKAHIDQARHNELPQGQSHFWLAMIAARSNDYHEFASQLRIALQFTTKPQDIAEMQSIILSECSHEQIMEFWVAALRFYPDSPEISSGALVYAYRQGSDQELRNFAGRIPLNVFRKYPPYQQFLIYAKALYGLDLSACRNQSETLIMQYPKDSVYYITLAFCYAQSGEQQLAQSLLGSFELGTDYEKMPPYLRLCLVASGITQAAPATDSLPQSSERQLLNKKLGVAL